MKRKKLILYDSDADYVRRMSEYLENFQELSFEIHSYTEAEKLKDLLQKEKPDILLAAESVYNSRMQEDAKGIVIVLCESGIEKFSEAASVRKFQSAKQVVKEIQELYMQFTEEPLFSLSQQGCAAIIGFYSPVKRCCQTSASILFGRILSRRFRTLYLNFENYAGMQGILKPGVSQDLSDLIYFFENSKEKFLYRLQAMTEFMDNLAYVPPMFASHNLIYITGRQWLQMLSEIAAKSGYEYIILDLSDNLQGLFDILRICTKVYTITQSDKNAAAKLEQYRQLLQMYEYQDVLDKTGRPELPVFQEVREDMEEYTKSDLERYIRNLIREDLGVEISKDTGE